MYKKLLFFLLTPVMGISQVQIGQDIDGEAASDQSGTSVSLSFDGSIVAIGAFANNNLTGHVRIYENLSGVWTQIGDDIDGEAPGDSSGRSVSLSSDGTILAIGAPNSSKNGITQSGYVRIFQNFSGVWTQIGDDIDGEAVGGRSGESVSLSSDGNVIAVGAPHVSNVVRVYENISGVWTQIGDDIDKGNGERSGWSVSLSSDGSVIAVGAPSVNIGTNFGYVRVYENISGVWTQIGNDIDGEAAGDSSGTSVSLSSNGTILAIGAPYNDGNGNNSGHVRVYENISGVWTQIGNDIDGEAAGDTSGFSVSLSSDGTVIAIGALLNGGNGTYSGHVRIFQNISGVWVQIGTDIDGEASGDWSGSVSLSSDGKTVAIGAPQNSNGNGNYSGHVRVYDISDILSTNNFISESFEVYPNPVSDVLNIRMKNNLSLENVIIYNNSGQMIKESKEAILDVSSLSSGIYFIEVTTNQGKAVKKVIVK